MATTLSGGNARGDPRHYGQQPAASMAPQRTGDGGSRPLHQGYTMPPGTGDVPRRSVFDHCTAFWGDVGRRIRSDLVRIVAGLFWVLVIGGLSFAGVDYWNGWRFSSLALSYLAGAKEWVQAHLPMHGSVCSIFARAGTGVTRVKEWVQAHLSSRQ